MKGEALIIGRNYYIMIKTVKYSFLSLVALPIIYLIIAGVAAVIHFPIKDDNNPKNHVIYVYSNGFHTDIILPISHGYVRKNLAPILNDFPASLKPIEYIAIGWGSKAAYTSMVDITDLPAKTIFKAIMGDETVFHITPIRRQIDLISNHTYAFEVSEAGLKRLVNFIAKDIYLDPSGQAVLLHGISQGYGDVYFKAKGTYWPLVTCNVWTGRALRQAGLQIGVWTPFAQSITFSQKPMI